jgi:hypothetical protein
MRKNGLSTFGYMEALTGEVKVELRGMTELLSHREVMWLL